jgi:hypothetical protein
MSVEATLGSINVKINTTSYLHQIDSINSISQDRWLPGQTISVNTSHVRFDPVSMSEIITYLSKLNLFYHQIQIFKILL